MGSWQAAAQSQFDAWSAHYDASILQLLLFGPSHDKLLSVINIPAHSSMLDVGCGTGRFAHRVLKEYPTVRVVGLDLSSGMLAKAAQHCERDQDRVEFTRGDSEEIPFEDGSFDLVTCVHSFHHYPHQAQVVGEMNRVLRPGGELVIVDADRDGWWGWLLFDWVVAAIEQKVHHCSAHRLRELMQGGGFDQVRQYHAGTIAPFLVTRALKVRPRALPSYAA